MESWSFLTNHARVLLRIAQDPGARLRDIAAALGITERSAYGIVTDLTRAGYVVKEKDGRRNRYQVQAHLPLPDPVGREPAIGDVLAVLMGGERRAGAGVTRPANAGIVTAGTSGTSASAPSSSASASRWAWSAVGAMRSKKRSSSTGTGMTRVLFFSAATSTTACSSRSYL